MKRKGFSKTFCLLYIYSKFKEKRVIYKRDILDELLINDLRFKRYIGEIREYLAKTNSPYIIVYERKEDRYLFKRKAN